MFPLKLEQFLGPVSLVLVIFTVAAMLHLNRDAFPRGEASPRGQAAVGALVDSLLLPPQVGIQEPCQQPLLPLGWKVGLFSQRYHSLLNFLFLLLLIF